MKYKSKRIATLMMVMIMGSTQSISASVIQQPEVVYYNQADYPGEMYGTSTIQSAGCAPCAMAVCISSFTKEHVSVPKLCEWAVEHGYYYSGMGSSHYIIPALAKKYDLNCEAIGRDREKMVGALYSGKFVVVLMGPGTFASTGHFMVLTGIDEKGKISVADVGSRANTTKKFSVDKIMEELKDYSQAGGPMWVVSSKDETEISGASQIAIETLTQRYSEE
ncbi:MAG: C39 family peptidase [Lachnospiraceae bacterium]|nr:C39 family peptidase [Lachnospiraceae bacterium]